MKLIVVKIRAGLLGHIPFTTNRDDWLCMLPHTGHFRLVARKYTKVDYRQAIFDLWLKLKFMGVVWAGFCEADAPKT